MKKIPYKFFWLSLLILFVAVFMPVNGKAAGPSIDKLAHILLFAFVSMNACYYFLGNRNRFMIAMVFVCSLPLLTEYVQTFIPGRNFENLDLVADTIGIAIGILLCLTLRNLITKIYTALGDSNPQV